ncbi:MAG: hypothetical protein ACLQDY_30770 [Streptosporangiaceae bacterium]
MTNGLIEFAELLTASGWMQASATPVMAAGCTQQHLTRVAPMALCGQQRGADHQ